MAAPSACDITLRCLGFCGADDSVEPRLLRAVSAAYEWVEWGVLFRPDKSGTPRYASDEWVARLGAVNGARQMRLAAHMCSSRVDDLLQGKSDYVRKLHHEASRAHARATAPCATAPARAREIEMRTRRRPLTRAQVGFRRVQINATAANGVDVAAFADAAGARQCVHALRRVMAEVPAVEFIMQRNAQTARLCEGLCEELPLNASFLFDESMGLGIAASTWPDPPAEGIPFGYAGGLSPSNLREKLLQATTATTRALAPPRQPSPRLWSSTASIVRADLARRAAAHAVG